MTSPLPTAPRFILPLIVFAQFCCTSLWFASNAVMNGLGEDFGLAYEAMGLLVSAVQFGFITGTLLFAILTITDRFSPSRVFLFCALAGAAFNGFTVWSGNTQITLILLRFLTGFCLAGIYPVGMKIAADYFDKGLGRSLGFLVGALVLGTALPNLLVWFGGDWPWRSVFLTTSGLAVMGGLLIGLFIPDGPFRQKGQGIELAGCLKIFRKKDFRAAAFGYFGHMWELYAFWAFVPSLLMFYGAGRETTPDVYGWSFCIIAIGGLACVAAGFLAHRLGERTVAMGALALSGLCCLLSPWAYSLPQGAYIVFLLFWGTVVVADSPLFSTLVAKSAPPEMKGTALTIVNCIGFAITIVSIQLVGMFDRPFGIENIMVVLAIGPVLGLLGLLTNREAPTGD